MNLKKTMHNIKGILKTIPSESAKAECNDILNKLLSEYSYVDATHDVINKSIDPTKVRENVERSIGLRQRIK